MMSRSRGVRRLSAVPGLLALVPCLLLSGCNRVLLDERFHDNHLVGWTAIDDPDTVDGPSSWRAEQDGWLHQRSNIWGRRGDFLGRWYGTYFVAGDERWDDYVLSLRAKPGDDDGFGVVVRFKDPEHFYRLLFIEDGFNGGPITRLDKRNGPDYTELWSRGKGFKLGDEMAIEVQVSGDSITVVLDGVTLLTVSDGSYARGKIGLFCYAQNDQAFDDVKVTRK